MNAAMELAIVSAGLYVTDSTISVAAEAGAFIDKYGVTICLLIYFLVRDYLAYKASVKREAELTAKLAKNDEFIRERLVNIVEDNSNALQAVNKSLSKCHGD